MMLSKIVHFAHVLGFALLHHTAVKPQPAGESGWKEQSGCVRREQGPSPPLG